MHDAYSFDTDFNKNNKKNSVKQDINNIKKFKLKFVNPKKLNKSNKIYIPLMICVLIISIINLICLKISSVFLGIIEMLMINIVITEFDFNYTEKINYYMYNIITLIQSFLKNTKIGFLLLKKTEAIVTVSCIINIGICLTLHMFSIYDNMASFFYSISIYGIILGILLCLIKELNITQWKLVKWFYIIQIIMFIREGLINLIVYNNAYLNHSRVISVLIILTLSLWTKKCEIYDFRDN